jgi:hypothetical protein
MSDKSSSSPLLAFSTALADHIRAAAPSLVSVQSERARSTGFSWRPGLIVAAENALPDDGEVSIVAHDRTSKTRPRSSAAIRRATSPSCASREPICPKRPHRPKRRRLGRWPPSPARARARRARPLASCHSSVRSGAACAAASSTHASNSTRRSRARAKAASRSTPRVAPLGWPSSAGAVTRTQIGRAQSGGCTWA